MNRRAALHLAGNVFLIAVFAAFAAALIFSAMIIGGGVG